MKLWPSVPGIDRLTGTTTVVAARMAACLRIDSLPKRAEPEGAGRIAMTNPSERQGTAVEQARDVGHEDRDLVGTRRSGPGIRPDEEGAMTEVASHLGFQKWAAVQV